MIELIGMTSIFLIIVGSDTYNRWHDGVLRDKQAQRDHEIYMAEHARQQQQTQELDRR